MPSRLLMSLVALIAMVASSLTPVQAAPEPRVSRELLFGIAGHAWWLDDHLDTFVAAQRDLGITSVRLSVDWKVIEPTRGTYEWGRYDRVLRRLNDEGFVVVGVIVTAPSWASDDPEHCAIEVMEPPACNILPQYADDFERMARATLQRYPFVRYWEFWNEPENWAKMGKDVGDYVPWLERFHRVAKSVDPSLMVAAGSLAGWDYVGWLYDVWDGWHPGEPRPWDAIAFHPYNTNKVKRPDGSVLALRYWEIERLRDQMVARGDAAKPIWVTEYGWQEEPDVQAAMLAEGLQWLLDHDYVTMAHVHMLHDWDGEHYGLMRTVPDVYRKGTITKETAFEPKEPYYSAYKQFARPGLPPAPDDRAVYASGQVVAPRFVDQWQRQAVVLGEPITRAWWENRPDHGYALVQYYERGRLEWTVDGGVTVGLLGDEELRRRGWLDENAWPVAAETARRDGPSTADELFFAETGHGLSGRFRAAWEAAGGLETLGFPRTAELRERGLDGSDLVVQYTQRGRLEAPVVDPVAAVAVGRLGVATAMVRGWLGPDGSVTGDYLNPARPEFRSGS